MKIITDHFPLILTVTSSRLEASEVQVLRDGFEVIFQRGQRYAVLGVTEGKFRVPDIAARNELAEWINHPRVREHSGRLCVAAAGVNPSLLYRVAFELVTTLQKPAMRTSWFRGPDEAVDFCLQRIREANLPTAEPLDMIRYAALATIRPFMKE